MIDEKYIADYYEKRKKLRELDEEVSEMSSYIKKYMKSKTLLGTTVGAYTIKVEVKYRPTSKFLNMLREFGLSQYIDESCTTKNFELACDKLNLNKKEHSEVWYDILFVNKKRK